MVGPRPKPIPEYEEEIALGHTYRADLRAGLSGPTQVQKGTVRSAEDGVRVDWEYADLLRNGSAWQVLRYDLLTLGRTIRVIFRATGE